MRRTLLAAVLAVGLAGFGGAQVRAQEFPCDGTCSPGAISLEKGETKITVGGQMQFQAALFTGQDNLLTDGDPAQEEGFLVKRARIKLGGHVNRYLTFGLATELHDEEDSGGSLLDAWMDYTPTPYFGLKAGVVELAWTRSSLVSSAYQACIDRPLGVKGMAPRRQAGAAIHSAAWEDRIKLQLGVYNSLQRGSTFYDGYESIGQSRGNRFSRFSYAGRLDVNPIGDMDEPIPDIDKEGALRANLGAGYVYNDGAAQKIDAITGDVHVKWYGAALFGGYMVESGEPADEPTAVVSDPQTAEYDRSGWFLEGDYTILKRLLGVHARYEWLDQLHGVDDEGDESVITAGVSVYGMDHMVKFQAEYQARIERHGAEKDNDTLLTQLQMAF